MSRFCKGHVWILSIFLVDWRCQAVRQGIIGRLGKVFGVGLNFFVAEMCRFERNVQPHVILNEESAARRISGVGKVNILLVAHDYRSRRIEILRFTQNDV